MSDDLTVTALVEGATRGDQTAWNRLVDRYAPLVMSVIRRYRLREEDARDVSQILWLRLLEHIHELREPRALPMWIITTTRHECVRLLRMAARTRPLDPLEEYDALDSADGVELDAELLRAERRQALREAFRELSPRDRQLLSLLAADPPVPYAEIGRRLNMAVGSIGPTRARCLEKLRESPSLVALWDGASGSEDWGGGRRDVATVGR